MEVAYASDLHLEMNRGPDIIDLLQVNPEVLILAGDINVGAEATVRSMKRYKEATGAHVILVTGNHEYYDGVPVQQTDAEIENLIRGDLHLHFLQNSYVVIQGVKFLGGTLWTDFAVGGPCTHGWAKDTIRRAMNDFRYINIIRKNGDLKKLTTDYWSGFHNRTRTFIYEELKQTPHDIPTVVVTHHGGHPRLNGAAEWKQAHRAGYVSDIPEITPCFWISGHTHEQMKPFGSPTEFLINCYGYEQYEPELSGGFKWRSFEVTTPQQC